MLFSKGADVQGLVAKYRGPRGGVQGVLASEPLRSPVGYYEVRIINIGDRGTICVGLGDAPAKQNQDIQPGWDGRSFGFHGDDGTAWSNSKKRQYSDRFATGDVVGCGYVASRREIFFTRNGKNLGACFTANTTDALYPFVGMHSAGEEVEFVLSGDDRPFAFDIARLRQAEGPAAADESSRAPALLLDPQNVAPLAKLGADLLSASYVGASGQAVGGVRAARAFTKSAAAWGYYEVTVVDRGAKGTVAVGLGAWPFSLTRQPGWDSGTFGYHGDDGHKFVSATSGSKFGPTFGTGDTVGIGIVFSTGEVIASKNGALVGVLASKVVGDAFFAFVGMHSRGEAVAVNFGAKPFVYDFARHHVPGAAPPAAKAAPAAPRSLPGGEVKAGAMCLNTSHGASSLKFHPDGLTVEHAGEAADEDVSVVAARPLQKVTSSSSFGYFEVRVLSSSAEGCVSIGLCGQGYSEEMHPGWADASYGYHSDDGQKFVNGSGSQIAYGPRFKQGDVVGCGTDFETRSVFFTKNGKHLGESAKNATDSFFPCAGMDQPGQVVQFNFGASAFVYDVSNGSAQPAKAPAASKKAKKAQPRKEKAPQAAASRKKKAAALPPTAAAGEDDAEDSDTEDEDEHPQDDDNVNMPGASAQEEDAAPQTTPLERKDMMLQAQEIIKESGGKEFRRSMLCLVGEGRSGKTALCNALSGRSFTQTNSTVGVEATQMEVSTTNIEAGSTGTWKQAECRKELEEAQAYLAAARMRGARGDADAEQDIFKLLDDGEADKRAATPKAEPGGAHAHVHAATEAQPPAAQTDTAPPAAHTAPVQGDAPPHAGKEPAAHATRGLLLDDPAPAPASSQRSAPPEDPGESAGGGGGLAGRGGDLPQQQQPQAEASVIKLNEELVFKYMNDQDLAENDPLRLSLMDFGGQDVFYTLHHTFLKRYAVYVVCFNMEWLAPSADPETRKDALSFIRFWLNSVAVHAVDQKGTSFAPVVLVGTHKDLVSDKRVHEQISDTLHSQFQDNTAWRSVQAFAEGERVSGRGLLWFFPIDNVKGHGDPVMQSLMVLVQRCVMKEEYVKHKVPFSWLGVYDVLSQDKRVSITLSEFEDIAAECGLPASKTNSLAHESQLLLKLLSNLGVLMYNSEPGLRHIVILNPAAFLAAPATKIICQFSIHDLEEHRECRAKANQLFSLLSKHAILDRRLLPILWQKFAGKQIELETLLVKFGLCVPLTTQDASEERYLVPAILPRKPLALHAEGHVLVCYCLFAEQGVFHEWIKSSYIQGSRARSEGFLPRGVFSRLLGKACVWCQSTTGLSESQLELSAHEASLQFGAHGVRLQEMTEDGCVRVLLFTKRPLTVIDALRRQISEVLQECVPNLCFALTVPSDGGQGTARDESDMSLVFLDGSRGLLRADKGLQVEKGSFRHSGHLSQSLVRERFAAWLPPLGLRDWYDVFISYRWGTLDSEVAETLFVLLSREILQERGGRGLEVFRDRERLEFGGSFQHDFVQALVNSAGTVPLVSTSALKRMQTLKEDSDVDNVLLEWTLIVDLFETGKTLFCVPIFIGEPVDETNPTFPFVTDLFAMGAVNTLPDYACFKCTRMAEQLLQSQGLEASKELHTRSVKQVVTKICSFLGVKAWDVHTSHGGNFISLKGTTVQRHVGPSPAHTEARLKSIAFESCKEAIMTGIRKAVSDPRHPEVTITQRESAMVRPQSTEGKASSQEEDVRARSSSAERSMTPSNSNSRRSSSEIEAAKLETAEMEKAKLEAEARARVAEAELERKKAELDKREADARVKELEMELKMAEMRLAQKPTTACCAVS